MAQRDPSLEAGQFVPSSSENPKNILSQRNEELVVTDQLLVDRQSSEDSFDQTISSSSSPTKEDHHSSSQNGQSPHKETIVPEKLRNFEIQKHIGSVLINHGFSTHYIRQCSQNRCSVCSYVIEQIDIRDLLIRVFSSALRKMTSILIDDLNVNLTRFSNVAENMIYTSLFNHNQWLSKQDIKLISRLIALAYDIEKVTFSPIDLANLYQKVKKKIVALNRRRLPEQKLFNYVKFSKEKQRSIMMKLKPPKYSPFNKQKIETTFTPFKHESGPTAPILSQPRRQIAQWEGSGYFSAYNLSHNTEIPSKNATYSQQSSQESKHK